MKFKSFRSITKSLTDMASSARMSESFDAIIENNIEVLEIDILQGKINTDVQLPITLDLHSWFIEQLQKENIELNSISSVSLIIELDYTRVATDLSKVALFHINSNCVLICNGKSIENKSFNKIWFTRGNA